ncbi:hypothetical protein PsYK624_057480 [Phanerochaete sordida]|uniref:Uncharacterized protein n=1 Tax=Phanerochaete sordida TaxID=48140 RepID=A0A9P3G934_9APHY|nr:hypothetical protein PsYK624_057480 [Phanerochaete sordida]
MSLATAAQAPLKRARSNSESDDTPRKEARTGTEPTEVTTSTPASATAGNAAAATPIPVPLPATVHASADILSRLSLSARCSLGIDPGDKNVVICARFWKQDGALVLWASTPVGKKLFKVHAKALKGVSKIFENELIMGFPPGRKPPVLREMIVNVGIDSPGGFVVKLEDHPDEIEHFLTAVYEHTGSLPRSVVGPDAALAIIKLGSKYKAKEISKDAIARIKASRMVIAGVDRSFGSGGNGDAAGGGEDGGFGKGPSAEAQSMTWDPVYAVPLANLAYDLGIKSILPLALYACYQRGRQNLVDGVVLPDGSHVRLHDTLLAKVSADISFEDPLDDLLPARHAKTCWKDFCYPLAPESALPKTHPLGILEDWKSVCLKRTMCDWCVRSVESRCNKKVQQLFAKAITKAFGLL